MVKLATSDPTSATGTCVQDRLWCRLHSLSNDSSSELFQLLLDSFPGVYYSPNHLCFYRWFKEDSIQSLCHEFDEFVLCGVSSMRSNEVLLNKLHFVGRSTSHASLFALFYFQNAALRPFRVRTMLESSFGRRTFDVPLCDASTQTPADDAKRVGKRPPWEVHQVLVPRGASHRQHSVVNIVAKKHQETSRNIKKPGATCHTILWKTH